MRSLLILFFLICISLPCFSQEPAVPAVQEDDPVSLYSTQFGDEDIELLLQGSWRAFASFGMGLRLGPSDAVVFPASFPLFSDGFYFEQVPDLTFTVSYADRFFLEVSVLSRAEDNTILLGYTGKPGEFVQKVLIGNKDTRISEYDFIDTPSQSVSSIGASALFQSSFSTHELLLRYDSTREEKKVFSGTREVAEKFYSPEEYLHGRYFMLPDPAVENLAVYFEDKNGSSFDAEGRKYRKANVQEIAQDAENGFLYILVEHKGRIAVHYTVGANTVGDAALGTNALPGVSGSFIDTASPGSDFDWGQTWLGDNMANRQLVINAQTCLLLWEPGEFSPFEMLTAYDIGVAAPEDVSTVAIKTIPRGAPESSYTLLSPVYFRVEPERTFFTAYVDSNPRTNFRNHYPFDDPLHQFYGPVREHIPVYTDYEIYAKVPTGTTSYSLSSNVVPGSVRVRRNGQEETRFTLNYTAGTVEFTAPIYPYDLIEIFYRVSVAEKNAGDILFAWGNRFRIDPLFSADIALGLRWNMLPGAYTEAAWSRTGALLLSSSMYGAAENLSYRIAGAVSYAHPDTTGILRLAGMEGHGIVIEPNESYSYPSAVPGNIPGLNSRGRILYRDFREYDAFGNFQLMPYTWSPPASQIWAYQDNSKPGPYLVAGNSVSSRGESLVLDFELDSDNDWAGFQIPFTVNSGTADLSNIRSIITSLRAVEVLGNFDVYIQLGALDEDTDNDAILDAEVSPVSGGFVFNDTDNAANLFVGGGPKNQGNTIVNSEDVDGNGFLDAEESGFVYTASVISFTGVTGWQNYIDNLSVVDQEALKKVRSIRVVVVANGAAASGRLLIDRITLAGTSVWADASSGYSSFTVKEVRESLASIQPAIPLVTAFPEVNDVFHSTGDSQEVLEITWTGADNFADWQVTTSFGSGSDGIQYKTLVLYVYTPAVLDNPLDLTAGDMFGHDAVISVDQAGIASGAWQKLEMDFDRQEVRINGNLVSAAVTIDPEFGSIQKLDIGISDTSSGTLLVDEIHLTDPEGRFGAALTMTGEYRLPGAVLFVGEVTALSDVILRENLVVKTDGFATLYSRPQEDIGIRSYSHAQFGLFFLGVEADFTALGSGDSWTFEGAHRLVFPNTSFPVMLTDSFTLKSRAGGQEWSRENSVRLLLEKIFSFSAASNATVAGPLLTQSWNSVLTMSGLLPYHLSIQTNSGQSEGSFPVADQWYGEAWANGFSFLVPYEGSNPVSRNWSTAMVHEWRGDIVSLKLSYTTGFNSFTITELSHIQKDSRKLLFTVPVAIGDILFETSYSRTLSSEQTLDDTGSLGDDYAFHFSQYPVHGYFFASFPLYEIISDDMAEYFLQSVDGIHRTSYKPEIVFSLTRKFGSSPLNLIVPSKVNVLYGREYVLEDALFNAFETISFQLLFNAINVFGLKSSLNWFSFYAIDTFSTSFQTTWQLREDRSLASVLFSTEGAYTFETVDGNMFTVKNILNIENTEYFKISEKGMLDFTWKVKPENGIELPLIDKEVARTGYLAHKEGVEILYADSSEQISSHPLTVIIKHETSIQYPEFGFLRGEIAFGFDWEASPSHTYQDNVYSTGLRLTLELNFSF
ncbi:MAG: hypothetical protein JW904_12100 [Spirochaetales bacterium]|nr:hypothetical protein [Spirochaetales bacterium]